MLLFVGVSTVILVLHVAIQTSRDDTYESRVPFAVGAIGCGAIFNAVGEGNEDLGWFALPILILLAPLVYRNVRRRKSIKEKPKT